ncbi:MAG TPA: hypothetical protein H9902_00380 [Candidatus Stackebrandtia faecavium]|nr:hypothetical protein [Candidatus Stackebrandtia faecavium]
MALQPQYAHMATCLELVSAFRDHAQDRRTVNTHVDIYCGRYGTIMRRPDIVVVHTAQREGPVPAANLLLVGDVWVSDTRNIAGRLDDYAQAEIPWHLSVIALADTHHILLRHLQAYGGYEVVAQSDTAGVVGLPAPFGFSFDVAALE